jgi:hypothetical protein
VVSTNVPDRGSALRRVRGVIERLVRDGSAVARSDGTLHSIFPVAVFAAEGDARTRDRLTTTSTSDALAPHTTCSGLRPEHGGWEVRIGAFAMCRALGENARAHGRGGHHQGRVAGGPGDLREVPPGDARAGRDTRCHRGSPAYLIDGRPVLDQALTLVTAYVAYYLYLAYAEGIVRRAQRGVQGPACGACSTT